MSLYKYQNDDLFLISIKNQSQETVDFLLNNFDYLSLNTNDKVVDFLIQNPDKISWSRFSANSNDKAVEFLIKHHFDRICWSQFSENSNDKAVEFLIKHHFDKIHWYNFSGNPNDKAVEFLIKHHFDKIHWNNFSANSNDKAVEFLICNNFTIFPSALYNVPQLAVLYLDNNLLTELPMEIGRINLFVLSVACNPISILPPSYYIADRVNRIQMTFSPGSHFFKKLHFLNLSFTSLPENEKNKLKNIIDSIGNDAVFILI
jgi:hypothetical protein